MEEDARVVAKLIKALIQSLSKEREERREGREEGLYIESIVQPCGWTDKRSWPSACFAPLIRIS